MSAAKTDLARLPKWARDRIEHLERRNRELAADVDRLSAPAIVSAPGVEYPVGAFIERIGNDFGRRPLGADEIVGIAQLSKTRGLRPDHTYYVTIRRPHGHEPGCTGDEIKVMSDVSLTLDFESSNSFVLRPKRY